MYNRKTGVIEISLFMSRILSLAVLNDANLIQQIKNYSIKKIGTVTSKAFHRH